MAEKDRGAKGAGTEEARADVEETATEATAEPAVSEPAPQPAPEVGEVAALRAAVATLTAEVQELRRRQDALELRFRHY